MPKFITIGYGDREGYDRTAISVRDAAHARDEALQKSGALMGMAGLPVQVRNHGATEIQTKNGPYMVAQLPIAGFAVIEASTMDEAIKMVSLSPCAVAYGVVEVWPLEQPSSAA
jgi:hypothetical protein